MTTPRKFLPDAKVCHRYGICASTLFRWDAHKKLGFPKPIRINGRKYRDERELDEFDRTRAADRTAEAAM
ncbi:MAG TPA: DNA-binding protein [Xanthobacteraceae bacterium]|nr:DNA-binding protein [Xanthobacteraceae bacterium]